MPETAKRTARVPILGENGRISDDYIPAAIGENTAKAEAAATRAEAAATDAEGSASAARQSVMQAASSASAASASATQAQQSATTAGGAATSAQSAQTAAEAAKTAAETAQSAAAGSAQDAQQSATAAASSAASVADKFIASAQATTLEPGEQATAVVENQVLTIGVPKGDKGDTGDQGVQGDKGDPGTAATVTVGSVTGLPAGSQPTVSNSGTANAAVLDFGIPKGDKGDKGDTGDPGADGEDGYTPQRGVDYWTAEDVEQIVEDAKTQAVAELAEIGNVPKRTVSDLVAHGEDAYAQKPIEVRVKGKTWVNRWAKPSGQVTVNGVTATVDETGLITLSGTSGAGDTYIDLGNALGVAPGKQYTLASSESFNAGHVLLVQRDAESGFLSNVQISSGTTSTTFTSDASMSTMMCRIAVDPGTTVNASFRVMLVDGTEAPDCFTPPASITSAQPENLVTSGKNLVDFDDILDEIVSNKYYQDIRLCPMLPVGTYTMSFDAESTVDNFYSEVCYGGAVSPYNFIARSVVQSNGRVTLDFDVTPAIATGSYLWIRCVRYSTPTTYTYSVKSLQLELGSTATAYEPPNVTTTPLPEVELRSLPNGTCDELVIKADGTCEVERRTQIIDGEVAALDQPTTEPQTSVTLPTLPAPTFNQYHDADVPSDTSTEYVRDINIVLSNLEAVQTALLGGE